MDQCFVAEIPIIIIKFFFRSLIYIILFKFLILPRVNDEELTTRWRYSIKDPRFRPSLKFERKEFNEPVFFLSRIELSRRKLQVSDWKLQVSERSYIAYQLCSVSCTSPHMTFKISFVCPWRCLSTLHWLQYIGTHKYRPSTMHTGCLHFTAWDIARYVWPNPNLEEKPTHCFLLFVFFLPYLREFLQ